LDREKSPPPAGSAILLATTNPGKIREIRQVLADIPYRLLTLHDVGPSDEPEETGATFAENARIKALAYAAASGLVTVAEDSGLVIDALGGRPGVESARYPGATYPEKFANLYRELAPHPGPWKARYVCAVSAVGAAGGVGRAAIPLFECQATVEGQIAAIPAGTNGFGYDPIFYYPPYGRTLGEVDDARKLAVAHRGKAFRRLRAWLSSQAPESAGS
jgi:XTP/dITP diphosphohydrolase